MDKYYLELIRLYKILSDGCKVHPAYRVHRKPSCDCSVCQIMYDTKQELINLETKLI